MIKNFNTLFLKNLSLSLIILIVLFLICTFGLFEVADGVFIDKDFLFDDNVFAAIKPFVNNTNTAIMLAITFLGSQNFLLPANIFLIGFYLFYKKQRRTALIITCISTTSVAVMFCIKFILQRQRPMLPLLVKVHGYSFPSGHTFTSVTFYGIIAYIVYRNVHKVWLKYLIIGLLICFILLIGFSRIYLRLHYASDVIAGFCLGMIWLILSKIFLVKKNTGSIN